MKMVKVIVGLMGSSAATGATKMSGADQLRPFLHMLKQHNVHELDTARAYNNGKSEEDLGDVPEAQQDFSIATKAPGFSPGSLAYERVKLKCNESLKALKQDKIDLYYFHGPDGQTPLADSLRAIHELHQEGKFVNFGISNYSVPDIREIYSICENNGYIKPSVYQGMYNPLARAGEALLFPTLRQLRMSFYGYSPLAGGYFSKTSEQLRKPAADGRMTQMSHFSSMFVNDVSLELHDALTEVCGRAGLGVKEATLRWLMHHSALGEEDGVILGGSSIEQMEENVKACQAGPLSDEVVQCFEFVWRSWDKTGKAPRPTM